MKIFLKLAIIVEGFFVLYPLYYGWEGGIIRAEISVILAVLLILIYFLRGAILGKLSIPANNVVPFLGIFFFILMLGSTIGFMNGYPIRAILGDLFPCVEFIAFFFLGFISIKTSTDAKSLIWLLIGTLGTLAWIEVFIYFVYPNFYFFQVLINGMAIKRVVDFTIPIGLLLLISNLPDIRHKRYIFYFFGIGMLMSIVLTFLKSVWISVPLSLIVLAILHPQRRKLLKEVTVLLGSFVLLVLLAMTASQLFMQHSIPFVFSHIPSLMRGLMIQLADSTLISYERLQYISFGFKQIAKSPIIGSGLGAGWWAPLGETRLAGELPPIRWRTDLPIYPLFITWKLGLLGLVLFGIIFWLLIRYSFHGVRYLGDSFWHNFAAAMLGIYIYVFLVSTLAFLPFIHFPIPLNLGIMSAIICKLPGFKMDEHR